jgi:predicted NBD/HSP70 family sugar kinase
MRRFLHELRRNGPSTRAQLTKSVGVTAPTSSSIIAELLELGLLEEADGISAGKGRPGKRFQLASSTAFAVGCAIDLDRCVVAPAGLDGHPKHAAAVQFETPGSYDELLDALERAVGQILENATGACRGIGLAIPGLVNERLGQCVFSPNLQFLNGRSLGPDLSARMGVPVVCTQEEHALCLSEMLVGPARELSDVAVVDFSSGVGMGVVSGGRYVSGAAGFAGEIGHITVQPEGRPCGCGNRGCLETVASDLAFLRLLPAASFDRLPPDHAPALSETLDFVAIGLAAVVNLFNPQALVLHGRMFHLNPDVPQDLLQRLRRRALRPSTDSVSLYLASGNKLHGALVGLMDSLFAQVGPTLS